MDILLTDIQERIMAEVLTVKYVDEDWGQLDDYSPNFPVKWPCVLVDCFAANYENMGKKGQLGLATVRLVIADIKLSNSSGKAPAGQKDKSKSFYLLMKDIYKTLHGWSGHDHYTVLIRTREARLKRNDGVRAHEMIFTVEIKDVSASPAKITAALPSFEIETGMRLKNTYEFDGIGSDELEADFEIS